MVRVDGCVLRDRKLGNTTYMKHLFIEYTICMKHYVIFPLLGSPFRIIHEMKNRVRMM